MDLRNNGLIAIRPWPFVTVLFCIDVVAACGGDARKKPWFAMLCRTG